MLPRLPAETQRYDGTPEMYRGCQCSRTAGGSKLTCVGASEVAPAHVQHARQSPLPGQHSEWLMKLQMSIGQYCVCAVSSPPDSNLDDLLVAQNCSYNGSGFLTAGRSLRPPMDIYSSGGENKRKSSSSSKHDIRADVPIRLNSEPRVTEVCKSALSRRLEMERVLEC